MFGKLLTSNFRDEELSEVTFFRNETEYMNGSSIGLWLISWVDKVNWAPWINAKAEMQKAKCSAVLLLELWRRAKARNASFWSSLRWLVYLVSPDNQSKLFVPFTSWQPVSHLLQQSCYLSFEMVTCSCKATTELLFSIQHSLLEKQREHN